MKKELVKSINKRRRFLLAGKVTCLKTQRHERRSDPVLIEGAEIQELHNLPKMIRAR